mmetsp:Transcript_29294/g.73587  ORF Transcript_29294/g.73587 Transcript_29294/m.73587 type:complete len:213 (+) Transcript_29294:263-901(+)|eukprot:jgi/Tetstr1/427163/TSEL_017351.t1
MSSPRLSCVAVVVLAFCVLAPPAVLGESRRHLRSHSTVGEGENTASVEDAGNSMEDWSTDAWNTTQNTAEDAWGSTRNWTSDAWNTTQNTAEDAWAKTRNTTEDAWEETKDWFNSLANDEAENNGTSLTDAEESATLMPGEGRRRLRSSQSAVEAGVDNSAEDAWESTRNWTSNAWNTTQHSAEDAWENTEDWYNSLGSAEAAEGNFTNTMD